MCDMFLVALDVSSARACPTFLAMIGNAFLNAVKKKKVHKKQFI